MFFISITYSPLRESDICLHNGIQRGLVEVLATIEPYYFTSHSLFLCSIANTLLIKVEPLTIGIRSTVLV